tara:strand:- start:11037 stop:11708 length:672 start_codon:yes stop_codon:yes gene_type:complete
MTNRWLISKEIDKIREEQKKLVDRWSLVKAFDAIETPMLRRAAAQVLENQRNEQSEEAEDPDSLWNQAKYGLIVRVFKQFENHKHDWMICDSSWPEGANLVGIRDDNRTVVLEDCRDTVWTVKPVEKILNVHANSFDYVGDLRAVNGLDPLTELTAILALEVSMEIKREVENDLKKLYCKNNIVEYNYCIHSFRRAEPELDAESFCSRRKLIMKYIKTATFGD